jgi:tetratricopeptide (TPR) repeat protein
MAYAGRTAPIVKELAHHFARGHDRDRAYKYLRLAGFQARDAGSVAVAMAHWQEAEAVLTTLARPDREALQVDLWWEMGSTGFAVTPRLAGEALEKLIPVLEAQWNIELGAEILRRIVEAAKRLPPNLQAQVLGTRRKTKAYRHRVRRGLTALIPPKLTTWVPRLLEAYAYQATVYGFTGQPAKGLAIAERARTLLPFRGTPLEGTLLVVESANSNAGGWYDQAIRSARDACALLEGRDLAGQPTFQRALAGAYGFQASGCFQGIRPDPALQQAAFAVIDQVQDLSLYAPIWGSEAIWAAWTGQFSHAAEVIERIVQTSRKLGDPPLPWVLYLRPYILWQQGEFDEAHALAARALQAEHLQDDFARQLLVVLSGQIQLSLGRYDAAHEALVSAEKRGTWGQMQLVVIQALLGRGELTLRREDPRAARQYLDQALALTAAGPARNPLHEGQARRLLGEAALAEGNYAEAEASFGAALAIATSQSNHLEEAHLHRLVGELQLAQGHREAALSAFREAGDRYHTMKCRQHLHAVNQHLEALHRQEAPKDETPVHPDARWKFLSGLSL